MLKSVPKVERPVLISLICILGFIGVAISAYWIVTAPEGKYESWYLAYMSVSVILTLIFLSGIWKMRKWGATGYVILAVIGILIRVFVLDVLLSGDGIIDLILVAIIIFVLLSNYSRMK